jgi:hypothetical protein
MEEVGHYVVAERCAREALALQPQDLWALHDLAHVLRCKVVPERASNCSRCGAFLMTTTFWGHLWWHLSLFKFSQARFDEVLDLFDREFIRRRFPTLDV